MTDDQAGAPAPEPPDPLGTDLDKIAKALPKLRRPDAGGAILERAATAADILAARRTTPKTVAVVTADGQRHEVNA